MRASLFGRRSGEGFERRPGGTDPHERLKEMFVDGVSSEVLYPTLWFCRRNTGL
jgi:hypothetical protein